MEHLASAVFMLPMASRILSPAPFLFLQYYVFWLQFLVLYLSSTPLFFMSIFIHVFGWYYIQSVFHCLPAKLLAGHLKPECFYLYPLIYYLLLQIIYCFSVKPFYVAINRDRWKWAYMYLSHAILSRLWTDLYSPLFLLASSAHVQVSYQSSVSRIYSHPPQCANRLLQWTISNAIFL